MFCEILIEFSKREKSKRVKSGNFIDKEGHKLEVFSGMGTVVEKSISAPVQNIFLLFMMTKAFQQL